MKFVFCEGKDDVAVLRGLAKHLGLDLCVEEFGGKNNLSILLCLSVSRQKKIVPATKVLPLKISTKKETNFQIALTMHRMLLKVGFFFKF